VTKLNINKEHEIVGRELVYKVKSNDKLKSGDPVYISGMDNEVLLVSKAEYKVK